MGIFVRESPPLSAVLIVRDISAKQSLFSGKYKVFIYTGCPKKFYIILRLNFGAVHFSVTKMLLLNDSRDV